MTVDLLGIASHDFDGGRLFSLRGELDVCTSQGLLEALTGPPGALLVVDLNQLDFMDCSGLGVLHAAKRRAIGAGGNLVVCRPQPMISRLLQITALESWVSDWDPSWSHRTEVEARQEEADWPFRRAVRGPEMHGHLTGPAHFSIRSFVSPGRVLRRWGDESAGGQGNPLTTAVEGYCGLVMT